MYREENESPYIPFSLPRYTPTMYSEGSRQVITVMREFKDKSFEELRLQIYGIGLRYKSSFEELRLQSYGIELRYTPAIYSMGYMQAITTMHEFKDKSS